LRSLVMEIEQGDLLEWQARYSGWFDHGRATSLNLFEHLHGESRERGPAMVELKALYARHGLSLASIELPDALPVFLEFLSTQPRDVARLQLRDAADAIRAIGEALAVRRSPYAAVPQVLLSIAGVAGLSARPVLPPEPPPDAEWAEAPVSFGAPQGVVSQVMRFVRRGRG
ncbi:MAG: nitrate reductase molybdenum cofactor assembly chaperone, partial [Burkholderiaceae bacterium]